MAMRMPAMRSMGGGSRGYPRMGGAVRGVADPVDYSQLDQPQPAPAADPTAAPDQSAQPTGGVMGALRQPAPQASQGGGMLSGLFGGGGGGIDFGDKLGKLGAIMMMLDPMSAHAGMAMMQLNQQGAANRRETQRQNDTAKWIESQGVKPSEAAFLAANPTALNAWNTKRMAGANPKWEFKEITTADGKGTQTVMIDPSDPTKMQPIGGVKPFSERNPIVVGGNAYDPITHELVIKGGEEKAPTVRRGIAADGTEQDEQWNPQTNQWDPIGGKKAPAGGITITNPDGTVTQIGGAGGKGDTKEQREDVNYATRMKQAEGDIQKFTPELTAAGDNVIGAVGDIIPGGGGKLFKKGMQSQGYRSGYNSGRAFLTGLLRKESGAAIGEDEWDSYGDIFIPQYNDSKEEIARKVQRRAAATAAIDENMSDADRKKVIDSLATAARAGNEPAPPAQDQQGANAPAAAAAQPAAAAKPPPAPPMTKTAAGAGVDPAVWAHMTPEERAAFNDT